MDNVSIFVKCARIMFLMKERNDLAFSHLMGKKSGTENRVHSKLANPRLPES